MNREILKLKNINLSYNKKTYILKDISFSVFSWEILSVIWLNWSWKSSLLKIISNIQKPDSWEIIKNYKHLWYVAQKINLDDLFPITVREFIEIYNLDTNLDKILSMLDKFWANSLINKRIDRLSGWELQKVLIVS